MITQDLKLKKVVDLMSSNILTAHVDNSFTHVLRLFSEMTFHHLPIVNKKEELVGMISSNDLLKRLSSKMPFLNDLTDEKLNQEFDLLDLMSANPIVISPEATIEEALSIFQEEHFHALPVVKDKQIIGIITSNDVLRALNN